MPKPKYVRVRLEESGHETTVSAARFKTGQPGDHRDGMTVIDKPAVDARGLPLPPKSKTSVDQAAEKRNPTPTPTVQGGVSASKPAEEGSK